MTSPMPDNLKPVENIDEFLKYLGLEGSGCFYLLSKGLYETKMWALMRMEKFLAIDIKNNGSSNGKAVIIYKQVVAKIKSMASVNMEIEPVCEKVVPKKEEKHVYFSDDEDYDDKYC